MHGVRIAENMHGFMVYLQQQVQTLTHCPQLRVDGIKASRRLNEGSIVVHSSSLDGPLDRLLLLLQKLGLFAQPI